MINCIIDEFNRHKDIPKEEYLQHIEAIYEWIEENNLIQDANELNKAKEYFLANEVFLTNGMTKKGKDFIVTVYKDLDINDTSEETKSKLDKLFSDFDFPFTYRGHRLKGFSLTDNIANGVGKGKFGYGLRKKDGSGLDFTKETKKKLNKEREAFMKGDNKFGQFSNLFTEANRAIMFRQQIGNRLLTNPKKFPPELHNKVVSLDKKYMKGEDPVGYLNGLEQKEIHRAYLEYKALWLQVQNWDNTHFAFDYDNIRGILMDPDDDSKYDDIEASLAGTTLGNKMDKAHDWMRAHRTKVAVIASACLGLLMAIQAYSYILYGHGILFMALKKFGKWLSVQNKMDNAIKGTPYEAEWKSLKQEVYSAKTPEENKEAIAKLQKFAKMIQQSINKGFSMTYDDLLEETFSIKSMIVNPKVVGTVIGSLASALVLTKLARMNARRVSNTRELYAKVDETAERVNEIMRNPSHQHFLGRYQEEWKSLYKEIKSTPDNDTRLVKQCDDRLNTFGNKVVEALKRDIERIKGEIQQRKDDEQANKIINKLEEKNFSTRLHSIINFSLISKRDDVLNSLRLVFKEMPKDAPQLNQVFLAIQSKYFKERMGTYDIEALKPKVQAMSESSLEECNTELRGLLKEIRNFNKNPIINKGPRGNKVPQDNDLNKIERLGRDIGKNARNILTPVSLGLGAVLTGKKLLGHAR